MRQSTILAQSYQHELSGLSLRPPQSAMQMARGRKTPQKTYADGAAGAKRLKKRILFRLAVLRAWADSMLGAEPQS